MIFGEVWRLWGFCEGLGTAAACLDGGTRVCHVDESRLRHSEGMRRPDLKIAIISPFNWE